MPKHVFLSFVEEDLELVRLFRGQAQNKNNDLSFADYSVKIPFDSTDSDYIRRQIREKISASSLLLCLIGRTTATSRWVSWEIKTAAELQKRVGGVRLHSDDKDIVPQALIDAGGRVMNWDIDAIVAWIGK
jgi:hypothetical protein